MHLEGLILCTCDDGHNFYIHDSEPVDVDEVNCPMCFGTVETSANRTVLVAVTGKETLELLEKYGRPEGNK